jgi:hypothetical protein
MKGPPGIRPLEVLKQKAIGGSKDIMTVVDQNYNYLLN